MSQRDDLDRMMSAWLDDPYTPPAPAYLGEVLEQTRHTRQRPAWASLERWLPMAVITRPLTAPMPLRLVYLALVALLLAALAASIAFVGSQLLRASAAVPRGGAAALAFASYGEQASDIFTVRADGSDLRQLTTGPGLKSTPSWSPDGTRLAYRVWERGANSIVVMDAGGGPPLVLARNEQANQFCVERWSLSWSPDGTSLIFPTRDGCSGAYQPAIVLTDGSSPATRLLPPELAGVYATWAPDGARISFIGSEASTAASLYVGESTPDLARSGGFQPVRVGPEIGHPISDANSPLSWSPDSTEIAVAADESVYVVPADGSDFRQLAPIGNGGNPVWSPDGRRLAFQRTVDPSEYFNDRPCTVRTWIIDSDGTNEQQLDELGDGCDFDMSWSPDGTRIASILIAATPEQPDLGFRLGIRTVDGSVPPVLASDSLGGSWQPVAAPLPQPASLPPA